MIDLPSKKFISTASAIIVALVLVYSISHITGKGTEAPEKTNGENSITFNSLTEKDSDNDGLKDWEEILWGTDPNNPDSDGDGTADGEEASNGRNPAIAGPDDNIDLSETQQNSSLFNTDDADMTKTDLLSRELLKSVLIMQKTGNIDEQSINDVSNYFVQEILGNSVDTPAGYVYSDLKIAKVDDKETIKAYGNELGIIIMRYYDTTKDHTELDIIKDMLNNRYSKDTEKITGFDEFIKYYEDGSLELLGLTVPKGISETHLEAINTLGNTAEALKTMRFFYSDPLVGVSGLIQYQKEATKLTDLSQYLRIYFAKNRIKFNEDDAGYIFLMN